MLGACGADVILQSVRAGRRSIKVRDFFLRCVRAMLHPCCCFLCVYWEVLAGGLSHVAVSFKRR